MSSTEAAYQEAVNLVLPVALSSREEQLTYIAAALRERFDSGMSYSMEQPTTTMIPMAILCWALPPVPAAPVPPGSA